MGVGSEKPSAWGLELGFGVVGFRLDTLETNIAQLCFGPQKIKPSRFCIAVGATWCRAP